MKTYNEALSIRDEFSEVASRWMAKMGKNIMFSWGSPQRRSVNESFAIEVGVTRELTADEKKELSIKNDTYKGLRINFSVEDPIIIQRLSL